MNNFNVDKTARSFTDIEKSIKSNDKEKEA